MTNRQETNDRGQQERAVHPIQSRLDAAIRRICLCLIPVLLSQNWACQETDYFKNWDPGPEVSAEDIDRVLGSPELAGDPYTIQLGQGVVFSDTQEFVGVGAPPFVTADTVRTIVDLKDLPETAPEVRSMTMVEHKYIYNGDETKQVSTEIPLSLDLTQRNPSRQPSALLIGMASKDSDRIPADPESRSTLGLYPFGAAKTPIYHRLSHSAAEIRNHFKSIDTVNELRNLVREYSTVSTQNISTSSERVTFHRLSVSWIDKAPPRAVSEQPLCGGVTDCSLRTAVVSFDMVYWLNGQPDRMNWRFEISPEAPFLSQILDRCVSSLVSVGEGSTKYLIKQCQPVVNFKFKQ